MPHGAGYFRLMTDLLAEYRPIKLWQRATAAALSLALLPIAAALVRLGLRSYYTVGVEGSASSAWYSADVPRQVRVAEEILEASIFSPIVAWIGFLALIAVTSVWKGHVFVKSWLATTAMGGACAAALLLLAFVVVGLIDGFSIFNLWRDLGLPLVFCFGFGAVYALIYWIILRRMFVRPPPDAREVFA